MTTGAAVGAQAGAPKDRLYHLEAVNVKSGKAVTVTSFPMSHSEIQTLKGKFTPHPARYLRHAQA